MQYVLAGSALNRIICNIDATIVLVTDKYFTHVTECRIVHLFTIIFLDTDSGFFIGKGFRFKLNISFCRLLLPL